MRVVVAVGLAAGGILGTAILAATSYRIEPGRSFGPVRETTRRADLDALFGPNTAVDAQIAFPEAQCTFGTRVFPDTPQEIEIGWQSRERTRVAFVRTDRAGWATPKGVRVGATLAGLVRLAKRRLQFQDFGFDYGGRLQWTEAGGTLEIFLVNRQDQLPPAARGDRMVPSDLPGLKPDEIQVARITQHWAQPWEFHDCHY